MPSYSDETFFEVAIEFPNKATAEAFACGIDKFTHYTAEVREVAK